MSAIDYDSLDKPVVELCRVINERLPGLQTSASCGGHPKAAQSGASAAEDEW